MTKFKFYRKVLNAADLLVNLIRFRNFCMKIRLKAVVEIVKFNLSKDFNIFKGFRCFYSKVLSKNIRKYVVL